MSSKGTIGMEWHMNAIHVAFWISSDHLISQSWELRSKMESNPFKVTGLHCGMGLEQRPPDFFSCAFSPSTLGIRFWKPLMHLNYYVSEREALQVFQQVDCAEMTVTAHRGHRGHTEVHVEDRSRKRVR